MGVLARADTGELQALVRKIVPLPEGEIVRAAQTGTVLAEGRAGGTGERFNIGDVTVTRCIVRIGDRLGFSYALGRDKAKAALAARLDALLQDEAWRNRLIDNIVRPLEQAQAERRLLAARKAAATKVDFFTLIRGEE